MSKLSILQALVQAGMTPIGACAMGGNMMAESNMQSNIAQRGMTKLTDEQYTAAADTGMNKFPYDSVGYGLCQWTYSTRKRNLLAYAQSCGVSVGDEAMQVQFCVKELQNEYPKVWSYLCSTQDMYAATAMVCKEYERPAVNNIEARAKFADELYRQYSAELTCGGDWKTESKTDFVPDINIGNIESDDKEPSSYILPTITNSKTAEAKYLAALLQELGYDVLWDGLKACVKDFQQKKGLTADGVCGEKTWAKIMEAQA